jgi:hypothetical protein
VWPCECGAVGPGRTGIFVDLGEEPAGFVDVLLLPEDPERWPLVGREGFFQVLQHRPGQVRLFPLDAGMRSKRYRVSNWSSGQEWAAISRRYPVGSSVTATVSAVFTSNREYAVQFEDCWSTVEYDGRPPEIGAVGVFVVTRLLEWTRQIMVEPPG